MEIQNQKAIEFNQKAQSTWMDKKQDRSQTLSPHTKMGNYMRVWGC